MVRKASLFVILRQITDPDLLETAMFSQEKALWDQQSRHKTQISRGLFATCLLTQ
jgi:hypothetical protein